MNTFSGIGFSPSSPTINTVLVRTSELTREIVLNNFSIQGLNNCFFSKDDFTESGSIQGWGLDADYVIGNQVLVFFISQVIVSKSNIVVFTIESE